MPSGAQRLINHSDNVQDDFKTINANDDYTFIDAPKTKSFDDMLLWKALFTFLGTALYRNLAEELTLYYRNLYRDILVFICQKINI